MPNTDRIESGAISPAGSSGMHLRPAGRRASYLEGRELDLLEGVLDAALSELERSGVVSRDDANFSAVRLRLAAVILCHAGDGEADLGALRRAAIRALEPVPRIHDAL